MDLGYAVPCEEHRPLDIVRHARQAEEAGLPEEEGFFPFYERELQGGVE